MREEFLTGYVFPSLKAGAVYEHKYLLGTSLARPVIAKHQVEVALREGATAVAHGCTGKGNDQVRFELTYQALAPELKILAPWREWTLKSREDCLDYAERHGIPVAASREKIQAETEICGTSATKAANSKMRATLHWRRRGKLLVLRRTHPTRRKEYRSALSREFRFP